MRFCLHSMPITLFKHKRSDRFYTVTVTNTKESAGMRALLSRVFHLQWTESWKYNALGVITFSQKQRSRSDWSEVGRREGQYTYQKVCRCKRKGRAVQTKSYAGGCVPGNDHMTRADGKKHYWAIVDSFTKERWWLASWTGHAKGSLEWFLRIYLI